MKIAVASGKGGTGKTTVAVNLSYFFRTYLHKDIKLVDCDVEEPNDALFFPDSEVKKETDVFRQIPEINLNKCTFCKECARWCEFNAIVIIPGKKITEVDANLCHSCGACSAACKFGAIIEKPEQLGSIRVYDTGMDAELVEGRLRIGSAMQTPLIKELKKEVSDVNCLVIYDAPPGTSCPVVETVADADYVILVTEPTPFGLHDLRITVDMLNVLKVCFGVVINKAGLGDDKVYRYLEHKKIDIIGEIPFSKEYAASYASGAILDNIPDKIKYTYQGILTNLQAKLQL